MFLTGADLQKSIDQINDYIISMYAPKNFDPNSDEYDVKYVRKAFNDNMFTLEEMGVQNPRTLTLYEYEAKIDYLKAKQKPS